MHMLFINSINFYTNLYILTEKFPHLGAADLPQHLAKPLQQCHGREKNLWQSPEPPLSGKRTVKKCEEDRPLYPLCIRHIVHIY